MAIAGMTRYDSNVDGALGAFDDFDVRDRINGKLVGTFWDGERSRLSLIGEYKGGATTAIGSDEAGLGYRVVNSYGGSAEGVITQTVRLILALWRVIIAANETIPLMAFATSRVRIAHALGQRLLQNSRA